jgi:hypothetical protein
MEFKEAIAIILETPASRKKGMRNRLGKHHSQEAKLKISRALKGKKNHLGKKHSDETKLKMSIAHRGKNESKNM